MFIERNWLYLQQADPAGGSGAPASGTPAAPAPAAPAPAAGSPPPSAPAPTPSGDAAPAPSGEPSGTPGADPAAAAASPGTDILKVAEGKLAELETSLSQALGAPAPLASPVGMPGPAEPVAPAAAPPPPAAPPAPTRIALTPDQRSDFYRRYSDANLNDEQSVGLLLEEAANIARESILKEVTSSPQVVDGLMRQIRDRNVRQGQVADQITKTVKSVEGWWKSIVPDADTEHIWVFTPMASQAHPVPQNATPEQTRKIHAQQAYFCLKQYLAIRGNISHPANDAINRGQGVVLPGSSGAPTGGAPASDGTVQSFHEQLRANRIKG